MKPQKAHYVATLFRNGKTQLLDIIAFSLEEAGQIAEQQKGNYKILQISAKQSQ